MHRITLRLLALIVLAAALPVPGTSQSNSKLEMFFRRDVGFTADQIDAIRNGEAVAKALPSRTPAEVFLFGGVYIHAAPESYLQFARDYDRLRKLPDYLALGVISNPPRSSDFDGLSFDPNDIQEMKKCKPSNCLIQMPANSIDELHKSIDWTPPNVNEQVNQYAQKTALDHLLAYQRDGNQALGFYNDKPEQTDVAGQFAYMLSYDKALPEYLPDFYRYLLEYPKAKPANVDDSFYWARVKFGLKPTVRLVHVVTLRGDSHENVAYAIAEKQLYSSHYFETALDMTFCIRGSADAKQPGFYLIMSLASEQAGLTGVKGSVVRKVAVGRSVSNLKNSLASIKNTLESKQ